MSTSCLVTKLKGTVDDKNLSVLGKLKIDKIHADSSFISSYTNTISTNASAKLTSPDSNFVDASGNSLGNEITINGSNQIFRLAPSTGEFFIDKYVITKFSTYYYPANVDIHLKDLAYMTNLIELNCPLSGDLQDLERLDSIQTLTIKGNSPITGDIANLSKFATLESISMTAVPSPGISGNIKSLGNLTSLTKLVLSQGVLGNVSGTIEEFVQSQRENGRTTCNSFGLTCFGPTITFNGTTISSSSEKVLSWTASTITYDGVTINV